ncbi:Hypothetical predicted protein, partial [Pelobates cultripes]
FVWNSRPTRIKKSTLELPKLMGGTGLPFIETYYRAAHLHRLTDWHAQHPSKQWVTIELEQTDRKIPSRLWLHTATYTDLHTENPLIDATLRVWIAIRYRLQLTSSPSPLTPITHNPDLADALTPQDLAGLQQ